MNKEYMTIKPKTRVILGSFPHDLSLDFFKGTYVVTTELGTRKVVEGSVLNKYFGLDENFMRIKGTVMKGGNGAVRVLWDNGYSNVFNTTNLRVV